MWCVCAQFFACGREREESPDQPAEGHMQAPTGDFARRKARADAFRCVAAWQLRPCDEKLRLLVFVHSLA